jgi:hypothetical protein
MKTIETTCGIYNTKYLLINHKDGSISIKSPFIKWINNTGVLAFKNVKIKDFVEQAKKCFEDDSDSEMSIRDIVDYNCR